MKYESTSTNEFAWIAEKVTCIESNTGKVRSIDFMTIELYQDNHGRTSSDPDFRTIYKNNNDAKLGQDAPKGLYIATTMGQDTVYFEQN